MGKIVKIFSAVIALQKLRRQRVTSRVTLTELTIASTEKQSGNIKREDMI
jgi:hypothetical protein